MTAATACRARTASLGAVAPPDGAHLRRADGLAVTQERQEQWLNTYESSSQPSTARAPTGRGGARAGRGEGISVGTPRCRRIRPITAASSMSAIKRRRPPHPGPRRGCLAGPAEDTPARQNPHVGDECAEAQRAESHFDVAVQKHRAGSRTCPIQGPPRDRDFVTGACRRDITCPNCSRFREPEPSGRRPAT